MEYIRLGQSGLKVSRLCLGTMNMGTPHWKPWIFDEARSEAHRSTRARSRRQFHRPRRFLFDGRRRRSRGPHF